MIKKIYKIYCDNCGALIAKTDTIPTTVDDFAKVGVKVWGRKHFCNEECCNDWKLHKR